MARGWSLLLFVLAVFVVGIGVEGQARAAESTPPFTLDKSPDFKPVGAQGHEGCYVAEVGKGVLVTVMYGTQGATAAKLTAMELLFSPEVYNAFNPKPVGFQYHSDLNLYAKHFYAHDAPHEAHMEHGEQMHPPGHR